MLLLLAQTNMGWEELARQVPPLAVALGVAWYAFKYIAKQQESHITDIRNNTNLTTNILSDAHASTEAAKDAQIKELQIALHSERSEKVRLLKVIDNIGATP